jgi:hypothetical protein
LKRSWPVSLLFLYCWAIGAAAAEEPIAPMANAVALRVNGQPIGLREVEAAFDDTWRLIQERLTRGSLKAPEAEKAVRDGWRDALQTVVHDAILDLLGEAHRERIIQYFVARFDPATPPSRIMDSFHRLEGDEVRRLRTEMVKAAGGEEELRAALKRKGQTMREWELGLRRELFRREVVYMNVGYIAGSPKMAREYFDAHPDEFHKPDAWRLRRIRIPKDRFNTPGNALQAAKLIYDRLKEGQEFGALASSLGYDPPTEQAGGLLMVNGQTDRPSGTFPEEERIAAKLQDGAISEPVDTGTAYLIVKREGYREKQQPTFEEAADQASALAYTAKLKQKKEEFFAKEKHDAFIEILIKDPPPQYLKPFQK